jgi:hypothetical protein
VAREIAQLGSSALAEGEPSRNGLSTGDGTRLRVWKNLYRAEVNVRYFAQLCPWYRTVERAIAILSAITASAAVTKWAIWQQLPGSLEAFSGFTAVLTIVTATTNLAARCLAIVDLQTKWLAQKNAWESAWSKIGNGDLVTDATADDIARAEVELTKLEAGMFEFGRLRRKAQDAACDALGVARKPREQQS